jgi:uncharacterized membrane protein required for colicin V production
MVTSKTDPDGRLGLAWLLLTRALGCAISLASKSHGFVTMLSCLVSIKPPQALKWVMRQSLNPCFLDLSDKGKTDLRCNNTETHDVPQP